MSRRFLSPVNLLHLASDPATGSDGDIYFNTGTNTIKVYYSSAWHEIQGGSGGGTGITVSETAPSNPSEGDGWFDNINSVFYVYDGTYWVQVDGAIQGNSFTTISVSGQSDVVAESPSDTLTLVAGTNVGITTNASGDSITINSTGDYTSVDSITYPDYITFDTTPETIPSAAGSIYWDSGESGLGAILNSNVDLKLGQENVVLVKNATGSSIAKGKVVYVNGAAGQRPTIALSDADSESTSSKTLGLTAETIVDGAEGFVTTFGVLRGVNTNGLTEGAALWLSSTAGGYVTTAPSDPAHLVFVGYVVKAHATSGEIFVNPQNGYELNELHDVKINGVLQDDVVRYDSLTGLWKNSNPNIVTAYNKTESTISAFTPVYFYTETISTSDVCFGIADSDELEYQNKLPAVGITLASVNHLSSAGIVTFGPVRGMTLTGYADGDTLYVAPGGGLTNSKPTGNDAIQPFAKVISVDNGTIFVYGGYFYSHTSSLPNLASNKIWLGSAGRPIETTLNTSVVPESSNLYFTDERAQDAVASMITNGSHTGISVEYVDSSNIFNFTNTGVTALYGTTHQIDVSSSTGGVTLSIPNDLYIGGSGNKGNFWIGNSNHNNALHLGVDNGNVAFLESLYGDVELIPATGYKAYYGGFEIATQSWVSTNYLTQSDASSTYLTSSTAASTYQPIGAYLTSETDPVFTASEAYTITSTDTSHWDTAYGWGDHSLADYLKSSTAASTYQPIGSYSTTSHNHTVDSLSNVVITSPTDGQALVWDTTTSKWINDTISGGASYPTQTGNAGKFLQTDGSVVSWVAVDLSSYLTSSTAASTYAPINNATLTGTFEIQSAEPKISLWDTTNSKGFLISLDSDLVSHSGATFKASGGTVAYESDLTDFITAETDPVFTAHAAYGVTTTKIGHWDTAYGWGNHASAGYAPSNNPTFTGDITIDEVAPIIQSNNSSITLADYIIFSSPITGAAGTISIPDATPSTSSTTGALVITGGVGIGENIYVGGNLDITGNFTVHGTITTVETSNLEVTDPLIYIATGNSANINDIGIVGHFDNGTYQHTGLVRDASDAKWKLFSGVADEPSSTINFTGATYDILKIGSLEVTDSSTTRSNLGLIIGTDIQAYSAVLAEINTLGSGTGFLKNTAGTWSYDNSTYLTTSSASSTYLTQSSASSTYATIASPTFTGTVSGITKSMVGLGNVENTTLSTWTGSSNITDLGTIASGTWQGTKIAADHGGTGNTSYTTGDILYASGSSTLSTLSATTDGYVLTLASGVPTWAAASGGSSFTDSAGLRALLSDETGTGYAVFSDSPTFSGTVSGITKSMVGLGSVENTALSTWAGTSNITTLGTIGTGTWQGTEIADSYITDALTVSGGTINNTPIGATTASTGKFTSVDVDGVTQIDTATTTISSVSATAIFTDTTAYSTIEYTIQAKVGSNYRSSKIMLVCNGTTTTSFTEYAILENSVNSIPVTFTATATSGVVTLNGAFTGWSAGNNITVKVVRTGIV